MREHWCIQHFEVLAPLEEQDQSCARKLNSPSLLMTVAIWLDTWHAHSWLQKGTHQKCGWKCRNHFDMYFISIVVYGHQHFLTRTHNLTPTKSADNTSYWGQETVELTLTTLRGECGNVLYIRRYLPTVGCTSDLLITPEIRHVWGQDTPLGGPRVFKWFGNEKEKRTRGTQHSTAVPLESCFV